DIEDGYADYVRKITGKVEYWFDDLINFSDVNGGIFTAKTMQAPDLYIFYRYRRINMNREELKRYYLKDPVLFNARYQAQGKYPGNDPLHDEIVPKGTLLASL